MLISDVNVRGEINSTVVETRTLFLNKIYNVTIGRVQYVLKWKGKNLTNLYTNHTYHF